MRALIVVGAPLREEYGAAQLAINFKKILTSLGHEVELISSYDAPPHKISFFSIFNRRAYIRECIRDRQFDLIDCPPDLISRDFKKSAKKIVCRSVQPDVLYVWAEFVGGFVFFQGIKQLLYRFFNLIFVSFFCFRGWLIADDIVCLGSHESTRLRTWIGKLNVNISHYFAAPCEEDRIFLRDVKAARKQQAGTDSTNFLWIGRWSRQKGADILERFILKRCREFPADRFILAGLGSGYRLSSKLKSLLETRKLRIIPDFSRSEYAGILLSATAGLMTSRVEGWGLVLNEMLESGLPVYSVNAGGYADLKEYWPGQLQSFPPERIQANTSTDPLPEYFDLFSWKRIVSKYMRDLFGL